MKSNSVGNPIVEIEGQTIVCTKLKGAPPTPESAGPAVSVRSDAIVRRSGRPKHRMARFKRGALSGWNYRGYCVVQKVKGQAGARWQMADESGDEWVWFFHTLA